MIRGILQYYGRTIDHYYITARIIYLLKYSCIHTLASKHNSTVQKTIRKYGMPVRVKVLQAEEKREETLINYLKRKEIVEKLKKVNITEVETELDFTKAVTNYRTAYRLSAHCIICGSTEKIQLHHVKHLRKIGKIIPGFNENMSSLNSQPNSSMLFMS
ncbi:MAG: hypothetical protein EOP45_07345 [Sphingobacteriaceae bacterium]|nr:MAG: hypothetical protein EOP45_07345 [Sphingobacteriaceae bacterium]